MKLFDEEIDCTWNLQRKQNYNYILLILKSCLKSWKLIQTILFTYRGYIKCCKKTDFIDKSFRNRFEIYNNLFSC